MDAFLERLPGRGITYTNYTNKSEAPVTHLQMAEASMKIDSSAAHVRLGTALMDDAKDGRMTMQERVKSRAHIAYSTGLAREAMRFLTPPVSQARPMLVTGGLPGDYPIGQLTPLTNGPVFIGRDEGGLFALSAICTHLGCTVAREVQPAPGVAPSGEGLVCPCHGSHFAADGTPLAGPASQALPRLALTLNDDGLVEVNLDQVVEPDFRMKI